MRMHYLTMPRKANKRHLLNMFIHTAHAGARYIAVCGVVIRNMAAATWPETFFPHVDCEKCQPKAIKRIIDSIHNAEESIVANKNKVHRLKLMLNEYGKEKV